MRPARLVATPSDIDLNQGVIIPLDSTYDSTDYIYINNLSLHKLTIGNTSTPQIHSMCIAHRQTPTTAVFVYKTAAARW